ASLGPSERTSPLTVALLTLVRALREDTRRIQQREAAASQNLTRVSDINENFSRQLSVAAEDVRSVRAEVEVARARIATLEANLDAVVARAENNERALRTSATNAVGKLRADMHKVLKHETAQIRRYLAK